MSDLFFAPSKPAWIKRFRKPAVCNKNPRFLCPHFPDGEVMNVYPKLNFCRLGDYFARQNRLIR